MAEESAAEAAQGKPKGLIVDRKFKPEDLKIKRNQEYVRDLGQCFKIFQKWGYDIIWVENGVDAMKAIKVYRDEIKCLLLEAYIPGGGFTIARLIRFKPDCKQIPVFLMSSQLQEKDLEEGKRIGIYDCMARPFTDPAALEARIKKGVGEVQAQAADAGPPEDPSVHITKELEKITNLPAMPTVYNEIEKLSRDPETSTEQYSQVIEVDPSITTQMLRLCNSSAFGFSRKITSVNDAVNLLGLQAVIDFVRTLSVVGAFKGAGKPQGFDIEEFWQHSIACGVSAKLLLERPEVKGKLQIGEDDPFMAGMVHDIGKQVLGYFFNEMFVMVVEEMKKESKGMYEMESEVLGITHADVGSGLATKWQLPDILSKVIGSHHAPGADKDLPHMVSLVHLSDICSSACGFPFVAKAPAHDEVAPDEAVLATLEMDQPGVAAMFKEIDDTVKSQVRETFAAIFS